MVESVALLNPILKEKTVAQGVVAYSVLDLSRNGTQNTEIKRKKKERKKIISKQKSLDKRLLDYFDNNSNSYVKM